MNKKSLTLLAENHRGGSVLVPTVPVGMPSSTLRVFVQRWTRERPRRHSHAERGNEMISWRRLASRQWPGVVERVVPEILFRFLLLLFLFLLVIFLILVLLLLLLFLPPLCRPPRSAWSAQTLGRGSVQDGIPTQSVGTR